MVAMAALWRVYLGVSNDIGWQRRATDTEPKARRHQTSIFMRRSISELQRSRSGKIRPSKPSAIRTHELWA
jgi:hypothetical protein